jgi:hypothetical protein
MKFTQPVQAGKLLATEVTENTEGIKNWYRFFSYFQAFLCALCVPTYTNLHLWQKYSCQFE